MIIVIVVVVFVVVVIIIYSTKLVMMIIILLILFLQGTQKLPFVHLCAHHGMPETPSVHFEQFRLELHVSCTLQLKRNSAATQRNSSNLQTASELHFATHELR